MTQIIGSQISAPKHLLVMPSEIARPALLNRGKTLVMVHTGCDENRRLGDNRWICRQPVNELLELPFNNRYEHLTDYPSFIDNRYSRVQIDNYHGRGSYFIPWLQGNEFVLAGGDFNKDLPDAFRALATQVVQRLCSVKDTPVTITVPSFASYGRQLERTEYEPKGLWMSRPVEYGAEHSHFFRMLDEIMTTYTGRRTGSSPENRIDLRVENYFFGTALPVRLPDHDAPPLLTVRFVDRLEDLKAALSFCLPSAAQPEPVSSRSPGPLYHIA